jgi:hypothetical protein
MFEPILKGARIEGGKMEQSEIKVTVQYIIKAPGDIMVAQVDEYINDALDEGADSKSITTRVITDVAFAERPGIVERMNASLKVLNQLEMLTDPANQDPNAPIKVDDIYPMITELLDAIEDEDDEEEG